MTWYRRAVVEGMSQIMTDHFIDKANIQLFDVKWVSKNALWK